MMMLDVGIYISGRIAGNWADCPIAPSEVEDLVHKVINELAEIGEFYVLERADGDLLDEESHRYTVESATDWESAQGLTVGEVDPVEFVIRRYVCVHETYRTFPEPTPSGPQLELG
jgi:hypothetical protein